MAVTSKLAKASLLLGIVLTILLSTACDPGALLTVENRINTDVTLYRLGVVEPVAGRWVELGRVKAGETKRLGFGTFVSRTYTGDPILFQARDATGFPVWEKAFEFDEFRKLKAVQWRICICSGDRQ